MGSPSFAVRLDRGGQCDLFCDRLASVRHWSTESSIQPEGTGASVRPEVRSQAVTGPPTALGRRPPSNSSQRAVVSPVISGHRFDNEENRVTTNEPRRCSTRSLGRPPIRPTSPARLLRCPSPESPSSLGVDARAPTCISGRHLLLRRTPKAGQSELLQCEQPLKHSGPANRIQPNKPHPRAARASSRLCPTDRHRDCSGRTSSRSGNNFPGYGREWPQRGGWCLRSRCSSQ